MTETNVNQYTGIIAEIYDEAISGKYFKSELDSSVDKKITKFINSVYKLDDVFRNSITSKLTDNDVNLLLMYSERMSSLAVRNNSEKFIKLGLKSLLLASNKQVIRGVYPVMSLLFDASIKVLGSAQELFEHYDKTYDKNNLLKSFLLRNPEDQTIDSMGFEEKDGHDGFLYTRNW